MKKPSDAAGQDPFLPVDSVARRVSQEWPVALLGRLLAVVLQATDPSSFWIFARHTGPQEQLFRRLIGSGGMFDTLLRGTQKQAHTTAAAIRTVHGTLVGRFDGSAPDGFPGREYSAEEPARLLRVLECLAHADLLVHLTFGGRLTPGQQDEFWRHYRCAGELIGLPPDFGPLTYREFCDQFAAELQKADLTPDARELGRAAMRELPLPIVLAPARWFIRFAITGLLPANVRDAYGWGWTRGHQLAFSALAAGMRVARVTSPKWVWCVSPRPAYLLVSWAEHRRAGRGRAVTGD